MGWFEKIGGEVYVTKERFIKIVIEEGISEKIANRLWDRLPVPGENLTDGAVRYASKMAILKSTPFVVSLN